MGRSTRLLSVVLAAALLTGLAMIALHRSGERSTASGSPTSTTTAPALTPTAAASSTTAPQRTTAPTTGTSTAATSTTLTSTTLTPTTVHPSTTTSPAPTNGDGTGRGKAATWRLAWGLAMGWGYGIASDTTVRDIVTPAVGGTAVKFRISNEFGNAPLQVAAATVGTDGGGAAIVPGTMRQLSFDGHQAVVVPAGRAVYTDPVDMAVTAGQSLAVSVYMTSADLVTVHPCCAGHPDQSYYTPNGGGNATAYLGGTGWGFSDQWGRWVDAADVLTTAPGTIVVVGDSITEGFNATLRWTDLLQQRVDELPAAQRRAIVNEGITANTLTGYVPNYSKLGGGPPGLERLDTDALDQPGVSELVLFLGTNDLWFGTTAQQLIGGYRDAIADAHRAGVRIVGVTLLPRSSGGTHPVEVWSTYDQIQLEIVDHWVLTSGAFAGVLDLAPAVADVYDGACNPVLMFPAYDSGDNLHPDDAGQTALANAVAPSVLGLPPLPQLPALVNAVPTPGCAPQMPAPPAGADALPQPPLSQPPSSRAPTTRLPGGTVQATSTTPTTPAPLAPVSTVTTTAAPAPASTAPPTSSARPATSTTAVPTQGDGHP